MFWQDGVRKNSVKTPFNLITLQNYFNDTNKEAQRRDFAQIIHSVRLKFFETVWKTIVLL